MPKSKVRLSKSLERKLAAQLFNHTWDLLMQKRRTAQERDDLVHSVHAMRYHWGRVGGPLNLSIAEWQVSRVYSALGRPEPARHHAELCLAISRRAHLAPFYLGYAYEALARASSIGGKRRDRNRYLQEAQRYLGQVKSRESRDLLAADLKGLP